MPHYRRSRPRLRGSLSTTHITSERRSRRVRSRVRGIPKTASSNAAVGYQLLAVRKSPKTESLKPSLNLKALLRRHFFGLRSLDLRQKNVFRVVPVRHQLERRLSILPRGVHVWSRLIEFCPGK